MQTTCAFRTARAQSHAHHLHLMMWCYYASQLYGLVNQTSSSWWELRSHGNLVTRSWASIQSLLRPQRMKAKSCFSKESSYPQRIARLWSKTLRSMLWFTYRGLSKAPNNISLCHGHSQCHQICWIIWSKWQDSLHSSLDLLQNPLLLWASLKTRGFSGHSVNAPV